MIRQAHERPEGMDESIVIMSGLKAANVIDAIKVSVAHYKDAKRPFKLVADYDTDNVSRKVLRIIMSYTDYVNAYRVVQDLKSQAGVLPRRALVTGATGFVGTALCDALRQQNWDVRRALRTSNSLATIDDAVVGDIGPATDWRAALRDVDVVIHLPRVPMSCVTPQPIRSPNIGALTSRAPKRSLEPRRPPACGGSSS